MEELFRGRARSRATSNGDLTWKTLASPPDEALGGYTRDENMSVNTHDGAASAVLLARIRARIKEERWVDLTLAANDGPRQKDGTRVATEIDSEGRTIRRIHLLNHDYQHVGWVCDSDVSQCMSCSGAWTWMRTRHHCRACGSLVCSACSPHKLTVANFPEPGGSRVCITCFALNRNNNSSSGSNNTNSSSSSGKSSARPSVRESIVPSAPSSPESELEARIQEFDTRQLPLYRAAYDRMRQLLPPDVARLTIKQMTTAGVPETLAKRFFTCRSLWLICMAPDDIAKVHIADFRSKYDWHGLDITELRAVYYSLPEWDRASASYVKAEWKDGVKAKLDDLVRRQEAGGTLTAGELRNSAYDLVDGVAANGALVLFDCNAKIATRYDKVTSWKSETVESPISAPVQLRLSSEPESPMIEIATSSSQDESSSPIKTLLSASAEKRQEKALEDEISSWCLPSPGQLDVDALDSIDEYALLDDDAGSLDLQPERLMPSTTKKKGRRGSLGLQQPIRASRKSIGGLKPRRGSLGGSAEKLLTLNNPLSPTCITRTVVPFSSSSLSTLTLEMGMEAELEGTLPSMPTTPLPIVTAPSATPAATSSAIAALLAGDASKAKALIELGVTIDVAKATTLLLHCAEDPESLADPEGTLKLLLDLGSDIDVTDDSGRTPLMLLFACPELGKILVQRGACILRDDEAGCSALQSTFEYGIEWLLDEFVACGREERFLNEGEEDDRAKYGSILLFGGYATKLRALLDSEKVPMFTEEEVAILHTICSSNMDNWKEPVEAYELLEELGAEWRA